MESLEDALEDKRARDILWLEILFNDSIEWEKLDSVEIKNSYEKACLWYGNFKTMIHAHVKRIPLEDKKGKIDIKEYRRFMEALNFVSA